MSKNIKVKFANLAEEVLKESDEALPITVIVDRVAAKALTKKLKSKRTPSNRYLRDMQQRTVHHIFKNDERFVKTEQEEWRVNLWTLAEE
jgi:hypothetical protein